MTVGFVIDLVMEAVKALWMELAAIVLFVFGVVILKPLLRRRQEGVRSNKLVDVEKICSELQGGYFAGEYDVVAKKWNQIRNAPQAVNLESLKIIVKALVPQNPKKYSNELASYVSSRLCLRNATVGNELLCVACSMDGGGDECIGRRGDGETCGDVEKKSGEEKKVEGSGQLITYVLYRALFRNTSMSENLETREILIVGLANANDEELCNEFYDLWAVKLEGLCPVSSRTLSAMVRGFLKNENATAALHYINLTKKLGCSVAAKSITCLFRSACSQGIACHVFEHMHPNIPLSPEALCCLLEFIQRQPQLDIDMIRVVEKHAVAFNIPLLYSSYDSLLKAYASAGDLHALELFEMMKASGLKPSEGTNVGVISLCAESHMVKLAEHIVSHIRSHKEVTLSVYSAMMKVYAYSGLYDKACDLYELVLADGIEPDSVMYGCLMKFAVECGRVELTRKLFKQTPPDIQNYMSLIRACGKDGDVTKALGVLEELKAISQETDSKLLDTTAYNCVLDVCVCTRDMKAASNLFEEMKETGNVDVVSYNTILKGLCAVGCMEEAGKLLKEMSASGFAPNDVSFNSMINAAVSLGQVNFAWNLVGEMEAHGVAVDHFTCSIMMKTLRSSHSKASIDRTLNLLDRIPVANQDEVLFNTLIDTCIRVRETKRLECALEKFARSGLRPSSHTYGTLIKANGYLQRLDVVKAIWHEMREERSMEVNEVTLGCMFDALVNANAVDEAMSLFEEICLPNNRYKVQPNTVMYSTLIKGFAQVKQVDKAIELYERMKANKVTCNSVTYNSLIDGCARVGAMEEACKLLEDMISTKDLDPDLITYSTVIKGFCIEGNVERGLQLFRDMQKHQIKPDAILFNSMLDGCAKNQRADMCDVLLQEMKGYNIVPSNFTLTILVKLFGRMKELERAFAVVEELPVKYKLEVNCHVYTCLMSACNANRQPDRALDVFEKMRARKVAPDMKTYGTVIMACLKASNLSKACDLLLECYMEETPDCDEKSAGGRRMKGIQRCTYLPDGRMGLDDYVVESLLKELKRRNLMEKLGDPMVEKLKAKGILLYSSYLQDSSPQKVKNFAHRLNYTPANQDSWRGIGGRLTETGRLETASPSETGNLLTGRGVYGKKLNEKWPMKGFGSAKTALVV